jgi:RIP metalloprotease RseP
MSIISWSILAFGCLGLILVHEVGHLLAARCCGLTVLRISVGFGPELCGLTDRYGTRWSLAILPLGGYLRSRDVHHSPEQRSLNDAPLKHAAFVLAGPIANVLAACTIYASSLVLFGQAAFLPAAHLHEGVLVLALLTGLSFAIGIFNLIPIPPLDGWKILLIIFKLCQRQKQLANPE